MSRILRKEDDQGEAEVGERAGQGLGDNCQLSTVRSDNCQCGQLSDQTTVRLDNWQIGQLSAETTVSGGNCQWPNCRQTMDNCQRKLSEL